MRIPIGKSFHELPRASRMNRTIVLDLWKKTCGSPRELPPSWTELDDEALEDSFAQLCADREFMLDALKLFPDVDWEDVPEELRGDPEVVLQCLKTYVEHDAHGFSLADVPEELRMDREFVLEAVRHGVSLGFIPEKLRADPEVAVAAVRANTDNLTHVPLELRADRRIVLAFVRHMNSEGVLTLDALPEESFMDLEVVLEAVRGHGAAQALRCVPKEFMDRENVLQVMRVAEASKTPGSGHADVLPHVPGVLLKDREFVMEAVTVDASTLLYVPEDLREDREIVARALQRDPEVLGRLEGR